MHDTSKMSAVERSGCMKIRRKGIKHNPREMSSFLGVNLLADPSTDASVTRKNGLKNSEV